MPREERCSVCLDSFNWEARSDETFFSSPCGSFCESRHFICHADLIKVSNPRLDLLATHYLSDTHTVSAFSVFHFYCPDRAIPAQYCTENIFPSIFVIREKQGKVPCPCENCSAPFDPLSLYEVLPEREKLRYETLLKEVVAEVLPILSDFAKSLRELLVLSCPNCQVAVGECTSPLLLLE